MYRALLLTGTAGVGKSTVADALGQILTARGCVTAVIDTDMLAQFGPPPEPNPGPAARPPVDVGLQGDLQRLVAQRPLNVLGGGTLLINVVAKKCRNAWKPL